MNDRQERYLLAAFKLAGDGAGSEFSTSQAAIEANFSEQEGEDIAQQLNRFGFIQLAYSHVGIMTGEGREAARKIRPDKYKKFTFTIPSPFARGLTERQERYLRLAYNFSEQGSKGFDLSTVAATGRFSVQEGHDLWVTLIKKNLLSGTMNGGSFTAEGREAVRELIEKDKAEQAERLKADEAEKARKAKQRKPPAKSAGEAFVAQHTPEQLEELKKRLENIFADRFRNLAETLKGIDPIQPIPLFGEVDYLARRPEGDPEARVKLLLSSFRLSNYGVADYDCNEAGREAGLTPQDTERYVNQFEEARLIKRLGIPRAVFNPQGTTKAWELLTRLDQPATPKPEERTPKKTRSIAIRVPPPDETERVQAIGKLARLELERGNTEVIPWEVTPVVFPMPPRPRFHRVRKAGKAIGVGLWKLTDHNLIGMIIFALFCVGVAVCFHYNLMSLEWVKPSPKDSITPPVVVPVKPGTANLPATAPVAAVPASVPASPAKPTTARVDVTPFIHSVRDYLKKNYPMPQTAGAIDPHNQVLGHSDGFTFPSTQGWADPTPTSKPSH